MSCDWQKRILFSRITNLIQNHKACRWLQTEEKVDCWNLAAGCVDYLCCRLQIANHKQTLRKFRARGQMQTQFLNHFRLCDSSSNLRVFCLSSHCLPQQFPLIPGDQLSVVSERWGGGRCTEYKGGGPPCDKLWRGPFRLLWLLSFCLVKIESKSS